MTSDRRAIREDGERLLEAARAQGHLTLATTWLALVWDLVFVGARHDVAQALRALVRAPGVTVGISLLLGLGVAATTTLFAFVDAVLLRPLPYDQPDRLVMMWESNVSQDRIREGAVPGQCPRLGRSQRCVRCDHRLDEGLGHPPGTRRRHADRRRARHARFLRRLSSSTAARAHVPCGRIRRRGVNHVAAGVERRTGHRSELSPVADPGRRSSDRWPDRLRGRPRLARDWCHAGRLRCPTRRLPFGRRGICVCRTAARVFRTDPLATPGSCASWAG